MTDYNIVRFKCRICGNEDGNMEFTGYEMLFGTREVFKYVECSKCKCIQIKNIPEDLGKYYPDDYNSFDEVTKIKDNSLKQILKKWMAKDYLNDNLTIFTKFLVSKFGTGFVEKLKPTKVKLDSKILDIGSGNGLRLVGLSRYGFSNITGIDPFIKNDINYGSKVRVFKKNMFQVDEQYDMVMLNHSFEHMINPKDVFIHLNKIIKLNNTVLIRIPVSNSKSWEKYRSNWVALDPPRHIYLHNKNTIEILASESGFKLFKTIYDSSEYQFIGSEQYKKGIPMFSEKSYYKNNKSIFTTKQVEIFKKEAKRLNKLEQGDTACFYLLKTSEI